MDDIEEEQVERLRAWWSEYGNYVMVGVVVGIAGIVGFNYQQSSKAGAETAASAMYDVLAGHVADGDLDDAERVASDLDAEYGESAYAVQAKLAMARLYMDSNRDADAAEALNSVINAADSGHLAAVARLRLAKIRQYQENYEEVLTLLDGQDVPGFTARFAEARGDALVALDRTEEAREAYLVALADNGQTVDTTFLQLKLLDLPVQEAEVAAMTDVPEETTDVTLDDTETGEATE